MFKPDRMTARTTRWMHRLHARLGGFSRPATGFVSQPEPRTIGSFARGRQLVAGNFLFAGHLVEAPNTMLWEIELPDLPFEEELHGFVWLDDLAAVADHTTRERAQTWLFEWIDRYGTGKGAGWSPDLTGRRIIRWIHHALFVLRGADKDQSDGFFRSLSRQTVFLSRRWHTCSPGLPRFEALTGLIYASLSLEGMHKHVDTAVRTLAKDCVAQVDAQGGILTRNPEELLEVFTLLTWAAAALLEAGRAVPPELQSAIERIAPTLRTLRHADGGLARFHGGGRGLEGRLDTALAASGVKTRSADGLAMGYARLSAGRTSVVVDASAPPAGRASYNAHASTLAFELTSGRRPLIVNCGSGAIFGAKWRRAGRATPSHSTLCLDGFSSARLGGRRGKSDLLTDIPKDVPIEVSQAPDGVRFEGGHDGYLKPYGLTHARKLELTFDGRGMAGEDLLLTVNEAAKRKFDKSPQIVALKGIPFQIRFHLHPEVDATVDMGGASISLALKSGELWLFRHEGVAEMTLEPSVYLEKGRLRPRATKQIVLSGRAMDYATRIRWSLAKAQDTPISIRDLNRDDPDLT
jgi:uncharacterized heparinase superfamily protein